MEVEINRDGCISCGLCESTCPEVFQIADDGLAEVINQPTDDTMGLAQEAADNCPVSVIEVK